MNNEINVFSYKIIFKNRDNKFVFMKNDDTKLKIHIKDRYDIFVSNVYKKRFLFFEASLSYIVKACQSYIMHEFFKIYFDNLTKTHKSLLDIANDFAKNPERISK